MSFTPTPTPTVTLVLAPGFQQTVGLTQSNTGQPVPPTPSTSVVDSNGVATNAINGVLNNLGNGAYSVTAEVPSAAPLGNYFIGLLGADGQPTSWMEVQVTANPTNVWIFDPTNIGPISPFAG